MGWGLATRYKETMPWGAHRSRELRIKDSCSERSVKIMIRTFLGSFRDSGNRLAVVRNTASHPSTFQLGVV